MESSPAIISFTKKNSLTFIALGVLFGAVFYFFLPQYYFTFVPVIFIYFYSINLITFRVLINSVDLPAAKFANLFTKISTIKFLGSLVFAIIYLIFSDKTRIPFLVIFIILYFLSLIQLVHEFLKFMNKKKST